jgi:large conductance mechanosensitive channel
MTLANEFKAFLMRGNVVDLAVAVVIGVAFGAVVDSLVTDLITPLIAAIVGEPSLSSLTFDIGDATFFYGSFLDTLFYFVTVAAAVFFFVVTPYNRFVAMMRKEESPDPSSRKCPECLSEIPADARRCAFCTTAVAPAAS